MSLRPDGCTSPFRDPSRATAVRLARRHSRGWSTQRSGKLLNIRGERSVTCKGDFDKAASAGPLPPGAPAACEEFRKMPDALERAAELDKQYGRNPDLARLPMYCAVFSFKDWYDAKDMRGTGGNDVNFAMDVPKFDSPDIATLRDKGAIIYAIASANNVGPASAQGPNKPASVVPETDLQYAPWSGQTCNPYDTARVPRVAPAMARASLWPPTLPPAPSANRARLPVRGRLPEITSLCS